MIEKYYGKINGGLFLVYRRDLPRIRKILSWGFPQGDQQAKKYFNLSWLRVRMSYHIFNNLAELLNGDIATKIERETFSKDLIDR